MKYVTCYFITALSNECGQNEVFDFCGSSCEPSCRDPNPQTCTFQCVTGCRCKDGFLRNDKGRCVRNCGREFIALFAILSRSGGRY
ncbi:unnamed protein product [Angiostrongylus costaricensis]|uniref:TIL domain-containing protein n=1 Tax=Angiostrongylus costaricensis TaxID=334426 RepID=A0A0R3PZT7_ANGCS|nr:unnamed protein product [Angiostrongylus costaricensis]